MSALRTLPANAINTRLPLRAGQPQGIALIGADLKNDGRFSRAGASQATRAPTIYGLASAADKTKLKPNVGFCPPATERPRTVSSRISFLIAVTTDAANCD